MGMMNPFNIAPPHKSAGWHRAYHVRVPDEAWEVLPRRPFVVTASAAKRSVENEYDVQLSTVGGDEMDVPVPEGSKVKELMQLVAEQCHLGLDVCVRVVTADGAVLEPWMDVSAALKMDAILKPETELPAIQGN